MRARCTPNTWLKDASGGRRRSPPPRFFPTFTFRAASVQTIRRGRALRAEAGRPRQRLRPAPLAAHAAAASIASPDTSEHHHPLGRRRRRTMMSKGRLEAFTDGVVAIIITIMVLEIKVPQGADLAALKASLPIFLAYALSYLNVGIFWNNHHHMLHATERINGRVLWCNLFLLFWR